MVATVANSAAAATYSIYVHWLMVRVFWNVSVKLTCHVKLEASLEMLFLEGDIHGAGQCRWRFTHDLHLDGVGSQAIDKVAYQLLIHYCLCLWNRDVYSSVCIFGVRMDLF